MNPKKYLRFAGLVIVLVGTVTFFFGQAQTEHSDMDHAQHGSDHDAQEGNIDFTEREQAVMPFDVTATLHIFRDTATGGVQRVIANDPADTENIALIRSHLEKEAASFAEGNFADPSYLHGEDMAGLSRLEAAGAANQLTVNYRDIENGGEITYSSEEADVVIALHLWFQAQVTDHGEHATN